MHSNQSTTPTVVLVVDLECLYSIHRMGFINPVLYLPISDIGDQSHAPKHLCCVLSKLRGRTTAASTLLAACTCYYYERVTFDGMLNYIYVFIDFLPLIADSLVYADYCKETRDQCYIFFPQPLPARLSKRRVPE
jgi:hypothetical protein